MEVNEGGEGGGETNKPNFYTYFFFYPGIIAQLLSLAQDLKCWSQVMA